MMNLIYMIGHKIGINSILLLSIIQVETNMRNINNYNDTYYSSYGYAQIQCNTARSIKPYVDVLALQIPEVNIEIAALYLKSLQKRYKHTQKVISAYNAGHSQHLENNKFKNQNYVDMVEKQCYYYSRKGCQI